MLLVMFRVEGEAIWVEVDPEPVRVGAFWHFHVAPIRRAILLVKNMCHYVTCLEWEPFVNKFADKSSFVASQLLEGQLECWPLYRVILCFVPEEFGLHILLIVALGCCSL